MLFVIQIKLIIILKNDHNVIADFAPNIAGGDMQYTSGAQIFHSLFKNDCSGQLISLYLQQSRLRCDNTEMTITQEEWSLVSSFIWRYVLF